MVLAGRVNKFLGGGGWESNPPLAVKRAAGFEDRGSHQTPFTSRCSAKPDHGALIAAARREALHVEQLHQRHHVLACRS